MLSDYFAVEEGHPRVLNLALESLQLYNDLAFRNKADDLKRKMERLPPGEEYDNAKANYEAYVKNIREEALRPPTD